MRKSTTKTKTADTTDPRIERSRLVITRAALEELGDAGFGKFTIESVAKRAGVGKSTIYRIWDNKLALISDAFETLNTQAGPDIDRHPPRERVKLIVRHVAAIVVDSTFSACIPALIEAAERDPAFRKFHHQFATARRNNLVKAIKDGIEQGDFHEGIDPELAAIALVGPIFYQRLMMNSPMTTNALSDLIDLILGK